MRHSRRTGSRIYGGSERDRLTPSLTAGNRGSDPRPLGPTMGGRPDRTCGERPRASRIATRPKVGPTNCEKKHIAFTHGVETVVGTERRIAIRLWAINSRHSMRLSRDPPAPSGKRLQGFLARVSDIGRMSGLRHSHRIVIAGHFSAQGMPHRPCVILPRAVLRGDDIRTRPWSPSRSPLRGIWVLSRRPVPPSARDR